MKNDRKKELICIACPVGCRLEVEYAESGCGEVTVIGNKCKRGAAYAREEINSPKRTVTAVVKTDSAELPYAPLRTDKPLPKELIDELLKRIYSIQMPVPLKVGQVIIENFAGSNVNVICTRNVPR